MHWSSKEFLELNDILAGWSGFKAESTPVQSKKITVGGNQRQHLTRLYHGIIGPANAIQILEHAAKRSNPSRNITKPPQTLMVSASTVQTHASRRL